MKRKQSIRIKDSLTLKNSGQVLQRYKDKIKTGEEVKVVVQGSLKDLDLAGIQLIHALKKTPGNGELKIKAVSDELKSLIKNTGFELITE